MIKITNIPIFVVGIIMLTISLILIKPIGLITEDYGITMVFFGLYFSLVHLIADSIKYEEEKIKGVK